MMRRGLQVTLGLAMFALYVWLCQSFYIFQAMDTCLDAGVGYDSVRRACLAPPFGEMWDTGARASYWFWLLLLGAPAVPVLAFHRLLSYLVSRLTRRPSNQPLQPTGSAGG